MEKSDAHKVAADLLRLRRWAVAALSNRSADPKPVAEITEERWRLFLSLERCACALLERLIAAEAVEDLSHAARTALRNGAALETQSVLTARAEGREIAKIASRIGFPIVVLKAGVNAIASLTPTLPLVDIDLLVERRNVKTLLDSLAAEGFGTPSRQLLHHQGLTPSTDRLAVEVHWTTHDDGAAVDPSIWNRLRTVDQAAPLQRLGATDNLLHLIEHAIVVHRDRSVSLRDTILIGVSACECTEKEILAVRRAIEDSVQRDPMMSLLDFAIAISEHRPVDDPFIESCATFYSAAAVAPSLPKFLSYSGAMAFVLEIELGRSSRASALRNSLRWRGTGNKRLAAIAQRAPIVGHALLAPAHLVYYATVAAFTIRSIRATRDRALSELGR